MSSYGFNLFIVLFKVLFKKGIPKSPLGPVHFVGLLLLTRELDGLVVPGIGRVSKESE